MKKLLLLSISLTIFQLANAQNSFYKNDLVVSAGIGVDVYHINETYSSNGQPNTTHDTTGKAGCLSYPIQVEYGLVKWFGLGLEGKIDHYFIQKDPTTGYQPAATGFEFGLVANFHIVRSQHVDFLLGLNLGGSKFNYTVDQYNDQVYGTGSWGDIHATAHFYFGRFGLFTSLEFPSMNYTLTSNNANWKGANILASWKATGTAFHIGLQYRFCNPPLGD